MTTKINNSMFDDDKKSTLTDIIITKAGKDGQDEDADAICGSPFAAQLDCPLLTVKSTSANLPSKVRSFLGKTDKEKLNTIYIIGGPSSVQDSIIGDSSNYNKKDYIVDNVVIGSEYTLIQGHTENNNQKLLYYCNTVKRLYGSDRYNTAASVAYEFGKRKGSNPMRLFFCYGLDMADGYSISAAACRLKVPLLFMPEKEPDPNTIYSSYIRKISGSIKKVFITGGSQRVFIENSKKLQETLRLTMPNCIERISGKERLDTSLSIAKEFRDYLDPTKTHSIVMINSNAVEVDLPIVGYYAAKNKLPVILVNMDIVNENSLIDNNEKDYLKFKDSNYDLTPFLLKRLPTTIFLFSNYEINVVTTTTARTKTDLK